MYAFVSYFVIFSLFFFVFLFSHYFVMKADFCFMSKKGVGRVSRWGDGRGGGG